jgi:hypothetical protein
MLTEYVGESVGTGADVSPRSHLLCCALTQRPSDMPSQLEDSDASFRQHCVDVAVLVDQTMTVKPRQEYDYQGGSVWDEYALYGWNEEIIYSYLFLTNKGSLQVFRVVYETQGSQINPERKHTTLCVRQDLKPEKYPHFAAMVDQKHPVVLAYIQQQKQEEEDNAFLDLPELFS